MNHQSRRALLINWVRTRGSMTQFEKRFKDLVEYVESLQAPNPETPSSSA
jgi:hypothetical protein